MEPATNAAAILPTTEMFFVEPTSCYYSILNRSKGERSNLLQPDLPLDPPETPLICLSQNTREILAIVWGIMTAICVVINASVAAYIVKKGLFRKFVSTAFIAHLLAASVLSGVYMVPIFLANLHAGRDAIGSGGYCRIHGFLYVCIQTVIYYMLTCIAGVHLLTFARIHYDQLFGLSPRVICSVSWVIGASLGLPCLTNSGIVRYDAASFQCIWSDNQASYKFLAYMLLLGVLLPFVLTTYAYARILVIFFSNPLVFRALGIFPLRFLFVLFVANAISPIPYYIITSIPKEQRYDWAPALHPVTAFLAYATSITPGIFYGLSIYYTKEDDIALTSAAHKAAVGMSPIGHHGLMISGMLDPRAHNIHPHALPQHIFQAQHPVDGAMSTSASTHRVVVNGYAKPGTARRQSAEVPDEKVHRPANLSQIDPSLK